MPNEKRIKARIIEMGTSIGELAKEMGLSAYTLGRKISGKTRMSLEEAHFLQHRLNISDDDIVPYFFTKTVA